MTLLAEHGHRLLPDYRFDPHTGLWRHARANEFPADVSDLRHFTGAPPGSARRLGEDAIAEHLQRARHILDAKPDVGLDGAGGLSEDFEALHWFRLPPECLA